MAYSEDRLEQIWDKGQPIKGKNPNLYRQDCEGNTIYKPNYGKITPMGWEVDHSKPRCLGGTDHLNNLQPMQANANRRKGGNY